MAMSRYVHKKVRKQKKTPKKRASVQENHEKKKHIRCIYIYIVRER